jgi:glucose/arabinose dehydrogenase
MRSRRGVALWIATAAGSAIVAMASCSDSAGVADDDASVDGAPSPPQPPAPPGTTPPPPPADAGADADAARPLVNSCRKDDAGALAEVWYADPKLCLTVFAENVLNARMLSFAPNGDLFGLVDYAVWWFRDANGDGVVDETASERGVYGTSFPIGTEPQFTHGLAFSPDGAFVYVSNMSGVFRWAYKTGDLVAPGEPEKVIANIPSEGHDSRTLVFDAKGRLLLHVGLLTEADFDPLIAGARSMVRRFTIPAVVPPGGVDYTTGDVVASGLRNEVGLAVDPSGRVWGVENGIDNLGDDNPAEELNLLEPSPNRFFGSPDCWSEGVLAGGLGPGTQWHLLDGQNPHDDTWCRNPANVQPPAAVMPAHWAPLGMVAYAGSSLPYYGDLLIGSHGGGFRSIPNGRVIARAHPVGGKVASVDPIVGHLGPDGGLAEGTWDARPVCLTVGPDGAVYVGENLNNRIFRLGYAP